MKKLFLLSIILLISCNNKKSVSEKFKQINKPQTKHRAISKKKSRKKPYKKRTKRIIITAKIYADTQIKNPIAEIISANNEMLPALVNAVSTNITKKEIIFPPIKSGLTNLKIIVSGDNIIKSFSDEFDTIDSTNKTVEIEIINNVRLSGVAKKEDGAPVTNFSFRAIPLGLYEKNKLIGHITTNLMTDSAGNFTISGLMMESYKLILKAPELSTIVCNTRFNEKENCQDFIFKKIPQKKIEGIVLYKDTKEPAVNVDVNFYLYEREKIQTQTDREGKFSFNVKAENFYGYVEVDEPGYTRPKRNLYNSYSGKPIVLFLYQTSIIKGSVFTRDGKPIEGVEITATPTFKKYHIYMPIDYGDKKITYMENYYDYRCKTKTPSDQFGNFVISNVAAPETYEVEIINGKNYFLEEKVETYVQPNQAAICDLIVNKKPEIFVKVMDENNKVVKNYMIKVKIENGGTSERSSIVKLKGTNEWYKISLIHLDKYNEKLSLCAVLESGEKIFNTNIPCKNSGIQYIILKFTSRLKPFLAGFIYSSDEKLLINKFVRAEVDNRTYFENTDHLGYFEFVNPEVKLTEQKEKLAKLVVYVAHQQFETNVVVGDVDIEWILPRPGASTELKIID